MIAVPVAFGVFSMIVGLGLLVRPGAFTRFLAENQERPLLHIAAVLGRVVLGTALILTAAVSRFPSVLYWLGWLTVLAAVVFALIERVRFRRLISWAAKIAERFGRFGGIFAALFGAFLLYAYL